MSLAMSLPSEIMQMILHGLSKRDLKSSRLACKHWAAQVPPLLFDTVFLIARYADLEVADLVMEKYGSLVTTLVYSAEHFEWHDEEDYAEDSKGVLMCSEDDVERSEDADDVAYHPSEKPECWAVDVQQHWKLYQRLSKEKREICHKRMVFNRLCRAFTFMPRIGRVVLTHSWRKREHCWCQQAMIDAHRRSHKPLELAQACPRTDCKASSNHQCIKSTSENRDTIALGDWWKELMKALDKTGKALQEITFESIDSFILSINLEHQLPVTVFDEPFDVVGVVSTVFRNLTHLRVNLDVEEAENICEWPWDQENFHRTFSAATNLKYLHIGLGYESFPGINRWENSDFQTLFRCSQFPHLAILSLEQFTATAEDILDFLQNKSPNVQCLNLKHFLLTDGYWMPMVQMIRDSTNVTDLQLHSVSDDLAYEDELNSPYYNVSAAEFAPDILEFFHAEKGSVFSNDMVQEILDRWKEEYYGPLTDSDEEPEYNRPTVFDIDDEDSYDDEDSDDGDDDSDDGDDDSDDGDDSGETDDEALQDEGPDFSNALH